MKIERKCYVCGKTYYTNNRVVKKRVATSIRPITSKTCSHKCSTIYARWRGKKELLPIVYQKGQIKI